MGGTTPANTSKEVSTRRHVSAATAVQADCQANSAHGTRSRARPSSAGLQSISRDGTNARVHRPAAWSLRTAAQRRVSRRSADKIPTEPGYLGSCRARLDPADQTPGFRQWGRCCRVGRAPCGRPAPGGTGAPGWPTAMVGPCHADQSGIRTQIAFAGGRRRTRASRSGRSRRCPRARRRPAGRRDRRCATRPGGAAAHRRARALARCSRRCRRRTARRRCPAAIVALRTRIDSRFDSLTGRVS